jgi:hypothetical protein
MLQLAVGANSRTFAKNSHTSIRGNQMKTRSLCQSVMSCLLCLASTGVRADDPAVLFSDVGATGNNVQLTLEGTKVTNDRLKGISFKDGHFKEVKDLSLRFTKVTDDGLSEFLRITDNASSASGLESLDLSYSNKITPHALSKIIPNLNNLQTLKLTGTELGDEGVKKLGLEHLDKLEWLDLSFNEQVGDGSVETLAELAKGRLKKLDLSGTGITGAELAKLPKAFRPTELILARLRLSDDNLKELQQNGLLDKCETLNLAFTRISDKGLEALKDLKNLKDLTLWHDNVSDEGMKTLASIKSLKMLHVEFTKITAEGVRSLRTQLPNCEVSR